MVQKKKKPRQTKFAQEVSRSQVNTQRHEMYFFLHLECKTAWWVKTAAEHWVPLFTRVSRCKSSPLFLTCIYYCATLSLPGLLPRLLAGIGTQKPTKQTIRVSWFRLSRTRSPPILVFNLCKCIVTGAELNPELGHPRLLRHVIITWECECVCTTRFAH